MLQFTQLSRLLFYFKRKNTVIFETAYINKVIS
jgi:hypothetical protein